MNEIKPALTAEEWAAGWTVVFGVEQDEEDGAAAVVRNRHGMAAKCLHGQPFGFTWEDVRGLTFLAAGQQPVFAAGLRDLADRIAALLPPRERA